MPRKRLKIVFQPEGSNLCGQAVVATLLGITLDQSINLFGSKGKTDWWQLRDILRDKGVDCSEVMYPIPVSGITRLPDLAVCKMYWSDREDRTHWIIKDGNRKLCTIHGEHPWGHIPLRNSTNTKLKTPRVTSYAFVERK